MKGRLTSLIVMVGVVCFLLWSGRAAPLPAYFDKALTYEAALERSRASGRPVFAYASADWCSPCIEFRRTTLADQRIAAWLTANTIPVYLDITSDTSPGAPAAASLGITSIPAIFLIRDGQPVGRHQGTLDAESLLNWLETFANAPPIPAG